LDPYIYQSISLDKKIPNVLIYWNMGMPSKSYANQRLLAEGL
jgi:hypothetical protein